MLNRIAVKNLVYLVLLSLLISVFLPVTFADTTDDMHVICGTSHWSVGGAANNARVVITSGGLSMYGLVSSTGEWSKQVPWDTGDEFIVEITGCCSHSGWTGSAGGTISSGAETDVGDVILYPNEPPSIPSMPMGPVSAAVGETMTYHTSSTDPEGHAVYYTFAFALDGDADKRTIGPYVSGQYISIDYVFGAPGVYAVRVVAMDEFDQASAWSETTYVTVTGTNHEPIIDDFDGPSILQVNQTGSFTIVASDPENSDVKVQFDWGEEQSNWTSLSVSGQSISLDHSWENPGTYDVRVRASDRYDMMTNWSTPLQVTVQGDNLPPEKPILTGIMETTIDEVIELIALGTDVDGGTLSYLFEWGDGTDSGWLGSYDEGCNISISHSWGDSGHYDVRVKTKDQGDLESIWSDIHTVTVYVGPDVDVTDHHLEGRSVVFSLTNVGDYPCELDWDIQVDGGLLFGERTRSGVIFLSDAESCDLASPEDIFGIGRMTVSLHATNSEDILVNDSMSAFLLFFISFELQTM